MKPWMYVTIGTVVILFVAARMLWFRARRLLPFVLDAADPADALGTLARVVSGTAIDLVAADAAYVAASSRWQAVLAGWLRRGARIRYVLLAGHADGDAILQRLPRGNGSLDVFVLGEEHRDAPLARDYGEFHFASFSAPDQLWLERSHAGAGTARDCEFLSSAAADERWAARREDMATLIGMSQPLEG